MPQKDIQIVLIHNVLIERLRPIVAHRLKNTLYCRIHTLDPEKERYPSQAALINEALEFYLDLIAPISTTPADRLVDQHDELDFRFVPWNGNTPTPQTRQDFQDQLKETIRQLSRDFEYSEGSYNYRKKEKKK